MNFHNPIVSDYLIHQAKSNSGDKSEHTHDTECGCDEKLELLTLHYFPDGILKKKCDPIPEVTEEVTKLAKNMVYTMMIEGGVGLAGPQVGKLLRIFVVDISWNGKAENADPQIFINPEIEPYTEEAEALGGVGTDHSRTTPRITSNEGCLSFPGGRGKVERYSSIRVKYLDIEGVENTLIATDYLARAIQHEKDHLDGVTIQSSIPAFDLRKVQENIKILVRKRVRELKPAHKKAKTHRR
jgi:peptide deformylase